MSVVGEVTVSYPFTAVYGPSLLTWVLIKYDSKINFVKSKGQFTAETLSTRKSTNFLIERVRNENENEINNIYIDSKDSY